MTTFADLHATFGGVLAALLCVIAGLAWYAARPSGALPDLNAARREGMNPALLARLDAALFDAASGAKEDASVVERLLYDGADPNGYTSHGDTALIAATLRGHAATVEALLDGGADTEGAAGNGWTAAVIAARAGHRALLALLLDRGASLAGRPGEEALAVAIARGHRSCTALLLGNLPPALALFHAAGLPAEDLHRVDALLSDGADPNEHVSAATGATALIAAAARGHAATLDRLVDRGATLDSCDREGRTAVVHAAAAGHERALALLLERGACLEGEIGCEALRVANDNAACRALLLGRTKARTGGGAGVHATSPALDPDEALFWAAAAVEERLAELTALLADGASPARHEDAWGSGERAVHKAAARGHTASVVHLLDADPAGLEAASGGHGGCATPLVHAAAHGHQALLRVLLERGATVKGRVGIEALARARRGAHVACVAVLLAHGANDDANATGNEGGAAATVEARRFEAAHGDDGACDLAELLAAKNDGMPELQTQE